MGDGESAEDRVGSGGSGPTGWTGQSRAIVDVNRLGQNDPTMLQHDMEAYRARWSRFGWHAIVVDGHDIGALVAAFGEAARTKGRPTVLLAKTFKGADFFH